jgi:hypothetical protein
LTPTAATCRAASPAAPLPPPARLAAEQRSIPRRPRPRRVELHQRRPHHCRRLLASQQSSGRSHNAHGRVAPSCITGSSTTAACSPRSRAAVDPATPLAASCRAASPAAPSPPPARRAAGQRSTPRRPWPRRVELRHLQLHRRRLLASQQSSGRSRDARGHAVREDVGLVAVEHGAERGQRGPAIHWIVAAVLLCSRSKALPSRRIAAEYAVLRHWRSAVLPYRRIAAAHRSTLRVGRASMPYNTRGRTCEYLQVVPHCCTRCITQAGGEHAHGPLHRGRPRAGHAAPS